MADSGATAVSYVWRSCFQGLASFVRHSDRSELQERRDELGRLPAPEVLSAVLDYLSPSTLATLSIVSSWCRRFADAEEVWRQACVKTWATKQHSARMRSPHGCVRKRVLLKYVLSWLAEHCRTPGSSTSSSTGALEDTWKARYIFALKDRQRCRILPEDGSFLVISPEELCWDSARDEGGRPLPRRWHLKMHLGRWVDKEVIFSPGGGSILFLDSSVKCHEPLSWGWCGGQVERWCICGQGFNDFVDIDPWAPEAEDKVKEPEPAQVAPVALKDRVLKMANVVDQADDSELTLASRADLDRKVPEIGTIENPPGSDTQAEGPAWALPEIQEFMARFECVKAWFHTCAYQLKLRTRWLKPAQFGGRLAGLESLSRRCQCPRDFRHEALIGKEKTSKAAQYPQDLVLEYARLVIRTFRVVLNLEWWRHLERYKRQELTAVQKNWIKSKEKSAMGPLIPEDKMQEFRSLKRTWTEDVDAADRVPQQPGTSKKSRREEQNKFYVGGMRNPQLALDRLGVVQEAGQDVLRLWRSFVVEHPEALTAARTYGADRCQLDPNVLQAWEQRLGELLKVQAEDPVELKGKFQFKSPLKANFWKAWQKFSRDPDEDLHVWAQTGAPLGMGATIPGSNGVFPPVDEELGEGQDAPEFEVQLGLSNYVSMHEDEAAARAELQRLVDRGFAVYATESDLKTIADKGTVSRLALITKIKDDGSTKHRVIVDLRRPGGNGRAVVPERIVLPRIQDLVAGIRRLWRHNSHRLGEADFACEVVGADLSDAYYHFGVRPEEIPHCVAPSMDPGTWIVFRGMSFGFKAAPLIMGRLSAATMRMWQSFLPKEQGCLQCYMDDPVLVFMTSLKDREEALSLILYTAQVFGLQLAYNKAERGRRINWIGVTVEIDVEAREILLVPPAKLVEGVLKELRSWTGMVFLKALRTTTGRLSWLAGIVPRARWAVSSLYAVLASAEADMKLGLEKSRAAKRQDTRDKSGLVHVKRMELPRQWLMAMLEKDEVWRTRRMPLELEPPAYVVTTDASPLGVGAVLAGIHPDTGELKPLVAVKAKVTKNAARTLGIAWGEPSGQALLEGWMVLLAVRYWAPKFRRSRIKIRADSTVALAMVRKLKSPTAGINWLGAELAMVLEANMMEEIILEHIPGKLNLQADALSRPDAPAVPEGLEGVPIRVMNEGWMLESSLPPPGVAPELWGKDPQALLVFENL
eukprot:s608_g31.t1